MVFKTSYRITLLRVIIVFECAWSYPEITIPLGTVRGQYKTSSDGRIYEAYESIPYALPPIGEQRFKPPGPIISRWSKEINGTVPSTPCMQYNSFAGRIFGDEDCLYLNVNRPRERSSALLPIIIGIHGGGFQFGRGAELGPKYIMDKDVIFITFNYRLGPLGFLSTGDEVISGNMGLKDQSLALRWVNENSKFFGGDADRITLVGISSGAASVQYHYLSPLSQGLFQNGISLSGTVLSPWAFSRNPLKIFKTLLQNIDCPNENIDLIAECLKNIPAYQLYNATENILSKFKFPYFLYLPVAERTCDNFFIDRDPQDILKFGNVYDVPWITGVVSEEGLYNIAGLLANGEITTYVNDRWDEMITYMLYANEFTSQNISTQKLDLIRNYYFENRTFTSDLKDIKTLAHLIGDESFLITGERAARLQATLNKSPIWFYYYNYRATESISDILTRSTKKLGVCHGDDAFCVFAINEFNPRRTAQDKAMSIKLLNFWYSIATRNLSQMLTHWPKVNPKLDEFSYLAVTGPNEKNFGNKHFWTSIML